MSGRTLELLTPLLFNQNIFHKFCLEPRLFKLYEELDAGEHGTGDPMCSYGLDDPNDTNFTSWNGTIVGIPNSTFDGRIFFLSMTCGEDYPGQPPVTKFKTKINLPCVGPDGTVNFSRNTTLANWNGATMGMKDVLLALKAEMNANRRVNQPGESETF